MLYSVFHLKKSYLLLALVKCIYLRKETRCHKRHFIYRSIRCSIAQQTNWAATEAGARESAKRKIRKKWFLYFKKLFIVHGVSILSRETTWMQNSIYMIIICTFWSVCMYICADIPLGCLTSSTRKLSSIKWIILEYEVFRLLHISLSLPYNQT